MEKNIDKAIEIYESLIPHYLGYVNLACIHAIDLCDDFEKAKDYYRLAKQNGLFEGYEYLLAEDKRPSDPKHIEDLNCKISEYELMVATLANYGLEDADSDLEKLTSFIIE